jgi:signal transduction histidine kinase
MVNVLRARLSSSVRLVTRIEPCPIILFDHQSLQRIIINLVLNASDAMDEGGTIVLDVHPDEQGGTVIRVADNGPGVPREIRERIFEPYFTTKDPGKGTGLGLASARELVESTGGTLELEDSSSGAVFCVRFPPFDGRPRAY